VREHCQQSRTTSVWRSSVSTPPNIPSQAPRGDVCHTICKNLGKTRGALLVERRTLLVERRTLLVERRTLLVERRRLIVDRRALILERRRFIVDRPAVRENEVALPVVDESGSQISVERG
jgi:hypothetical protein